jgi:putative phosphoribosyl transferase
MEGPPDPGMTLSGEVVFADRRHAGELLAARLAGEDLTGAVIVGLARGGVEVAAAVAERLQLPLDALAVRKVGHPSQPELAIGAVTPGGIVFVRTGIDVRGGVLDDAVADAVARADALDRRLHARRLGVPVAGRPCVLVDDGLATGATMIAAARWARARGARRVVVAVPVAAPESLMRLAGEADSVVCVEAPRSLFAVGEWYRDFSQVSDARVTALLADGPATLGEEAVELDLDGVRLPGDLRLPAGAAGMVLFAHGTGSSRQSPRNARVADALNAARLATLLFDLLTPEEAADRERVFDIPLLAGRLAGATRWLARARPDLSGLPLGFFGASTGAAAALWAVAELPQVRAVVSRGGRPDLAHDRLVEVRAATLLIVGGADLQVLELNRQALARLHPPSDLVVIPRATHLFEEPGALERVAELAAGWFTQHLPPGA